MTPDKAPQITLYYAPRTRAFVGLWLLEELELPYALESFDLNTGRTRTPAFRALNPLGKVPLIVDHGRPVSETGAIALYLADAYGSKPVAPGIGDPDRAAFLRWLFFAGNVIEPAYCEKGFGWKAPASTVGWSSYDRMVEVLTDAVERGPWLLGERFTIADVVIGNYLRSGIMFGWVDGDGPLGRYVARASERPSFARASAIEAREGERFPPEAAPSAG